MIQKMDKEVNCTLCAHRAVCGIKKDYMEYLTRIKSVADPVKYSEFNVEITCIHCTTPLKQEADSKIFPRKSKCDCSLTD